MLDIEKEKALEKLKKDFKKVNNNSAIQSLGFTFDLKDKNNFFEWKTAIIGPKDTSYSNGLFFLKIIFPNNYPNKSPDVIFMNPIYHLNVNPMKSRYEGSENLGHVSFSVYNWWNPRITIEELIIKLYSVFYLANPDSPYGLDRADEYRNNRSLYEKKVQYFTKKYADMKVSPEDYCDKDWDFSLSDKERNKIEWENNYIDIEFNINGIEKIVKCEKKELIKDIIRKLNIDPKKDDLLVIYKNRKIDINKPLEDYEINSIVIIIYDVEFA